MDEMAKFPYLTPRKGSKNLYYKRMVPPDLHADGRPKQIWRSLRSADQNAARGAYAKVHSKIEARFDRWRREDNQPINANSEPCPAPQSDAPELPVGPLTPAVLRRLADTYYLDVYDSDFQWRGDLWKQVQDDEESFWRGDVIAHPEDDWHEHNGQMHSYYAMLMQEPVLERVFAYCLFRARKSKLQQLQTAYNFGDGQEHEPIVDGLLATIGIKLRSNDMSRLLRKIMETEIKAIEDLIARDETSFEQVLNRQIDETATLPTTVETAPSPSQPMSSLIEKYLGDTAREREWPAKTTIRKRSELNEFVEIVGDKPVNQYNQADGVNFKDVQLCLPAYRQRQPFKGLTRQNMAKKASKLQASGKGVKLLSPLTIKDKIGTVSLFFGWAKSRDGSVSNPVAGLSISRRRKSRNDKTRHPWTITELNKVFEAPIYTGCRSQHYWRKSGDVVLRKSAMFWVPLIALYSGMRLGEIIQLRVADVKTSEGIKYFDVTIAAAMDEADEADEEKSLKTTSSQRGIPVHHTLLEIGFDEFLKFRRQSDATRLFPEYSKADDDGSWSKQFSKHFTRFRKSIDVTRGGVDFHSFRHNVEDALRNADVRKDVRDAIQGHGESGVSGEYGSGYYVKTLNEAVQKIEYAGLNLAHLKNS